MMDKERKYREGEETRKEFEERLDKEGVDVWDYAHEEYARREEDPQSSPVIAENKAFETQIINTLKERNQKEDAEKRADHDQLTGILNRHGYEDRLAILQRKERTKKMPYAKHRKADSSDTVIEEPFSMITLDLDHFKEINDAYGHAAGDEVLKEVTRRIQNRIRAGDVFARVGGEEFRVVILAANGSAPLVAEHLRQIIENQPFTITYLDSKTQTQATKDISVTISLGVSPYLEDKTQMEELSDKALYAAKNGGQEGRQQRGGRNQVWGFNKKTGGFEKFELPPPQA